jgi:hypothetical protein
MVVSPVFGAAAPLMVARHHVGSAEIIGTDLK